MAENSRRARAAALSDDTPLNFCDERAECVLAGVHSFAFYMRLINFVREHTNKQTSATRLCSASDDAHNHCLSLYYLAFFAFTQCEHQASAQFNKVPEKAANIYFSSPPAYTRNLLSSAAGQRGDEKKVGIFLGGALVVSRYIQCECHPGQQGWRPAEWKWASSSSRAQKFGKFLPRLLVRY